MNTPAWRLEVEKWQRTDRRQWERWRKRAGELTAEGMQPRAAEWLAWDELTISGRMGSA